MFPWSTKVSKMPFGAETTAHPLPDAHAIPAAAIAAAGAASAAIAIAAAAAAGIVYQEPGRLRGCVSRWVSGLWMVAWHGRPGEGMGAWVL